MISRYIVAGHHPTKGTTKRNSFSHRSNAERAFKQALEMGYTASLIDREARRVRTRPLDSHTTKAVDNELPMYVLYSRGTAGGCKVGTLVDQADTLDNATEAAHERVTKWRKDHNDVVIYKAIRAVQYQAAPVEVIEL